MEGKDHQRCWSKNQDTFGFFGPYMIILVIIIIVIIIITIIVTIIVITIVLLLLLSWLPTLKPNPPQAPCKTWPGRQELLHRAGHVWLGGLQRLWGLW